MINEQVHPAMNRLGNIRKIAVLRATNLGDFIASLPALAGLRAAYPDAEIVYFGKPFHKTLIESRPGPVDRVIVVPPSHGVREEPDLEPNPRELEAFFEDIQGEQFDLGIQMHGGGRNSNPFLLRLGAAFNVGMRTSDAPVLDRWIPYIFWQNEMFRLVELMRLIGVECSTIEPQIAVTAEDREAFQTALPSLTAPFVVLHPGASDFRRRWLPQRFAQVGDQLAAAGYQVVVTGVNAERDIVESVIAQMQSPAINACNRLSVGGLTGLLASAALVVSNDTGTMHLANATATPNVGIFWCVNYLNWTHPGRTKHRPLVAWTVCCPLCNADLTRYDDVDNGCAHETCLVAGVTVEQVVAAAFDLLAYAQEPFVDEKTVLSVNSALS